MVLDECYKYKARTFQTCSSGEICTWVICFSFTWIMGEIFQTWIMGEDFSNLDNGGGRCRGRRCEAFPQVGSLERIAKAHW